MKIIYIIRAQQLARMCMRPSDQITCMHAWGD